MKTEIKLSNILMDYKLDHLTLEQAENKILLLFSVSGRSEQLAAYLQDVIGEKYSIYFEQQDIDGLIE